LETGDFILVDMGARYRRYNSDITRTYIFGSATEQQRDMYHTVYEAQQRGFDAVKPGVKASDVHMVVDSFIEKTKFKGHFVHSTGHSLGLAVHDGFGFGLDSTIKLKENMVFTVEPGVYLPGVGGVRIEDDILVKKDGIKVLTTTDRQLREIPIA
jgi:Xaa-Pro dipeptidase